MQPYIVGFLIRALYHVIVEELFILMEITTQITRHAIIVTRQSLAITRLIGLSKADEPGNASDVFFRSLSRKKGTWDVKTGTKHS